MTILPIDVAFQQKQYSKNFLSHRNSCPAATFHFPSVRPFHSQKFYATQWPTCKPPTICINGSPPTPKNYEIALQIVENICVRARVLVLRFPDKDGPMNL